MSKLRFNLRSKKSNASSILAKCTIDGARFTYSTGISIPVKIWNDKRMRVTPHLAGMTYAPINARLDNFERIFNAILTELYKGGETPTKENVKHRLDLTLGRIDKEKEMSFNEFIDEFIERRSKDKSYKKESIKIYRAFQKRWGEFCEENTYSFEELDLKLLSNFLNFMNNHENQYADNTINKIIGTSKTILNEASEHGLYSLGAHKSRKYAHGKRPADNIYLTEEEVQSLADLDYSNDARKERVSDIFVLACCTGVRYSDFHQFQVTNLYEIPLDSGKTKLGYRIFTTKTGSHVFIPLKQLALDILHKYDFKLPKIPSNQKMNETLKEIAKDAGLSEVQVKTTFRNGRPYRKELYKYERVSTHTARRSFATNAYKSGAPIASIMKITGHKSIDTFMSYISIKEEENAQLMSNHHFFK